jgi:hypothetical protein
VAASGRTGVRVIAAIQLRAQNRLHLPLRRSLFAMLVIGEVCGCRQRLPNEPFRKSGHQRNYFGVTGRCLVTSAGHSRAAGNWAVAIGGLARLTRCRARGKKSYSSFAVAALRPGVFSRSDRPALAMSLTGPKANRGALGARSNLRIKISGTIFRYHGANATSGSRQRRMHSWRWHMTAPDKVKYLQLVDCNGL